MTFIEALDQILPIYDSEIFDLLAWRKHSCCQLGCHKGATTKEDTTVEYTDSDGKVTKLKQIRFLLPLGNQIQKVGD